MKRPGKFALWTALRFFGVFALAGALMAPFMLVVPHEPGSVGVEWPVWMAYKVMRDSFGIHEPDLGIMMLVGALGYGFIGFDLWLRLLGRLPHFPLGFRVEASSRS